MKKIRLGNGMYTILDDADYEELKKYSWQFSKKKNDRYGYAISSTPPIRNMRMHRILLGAKKGQIVDHINFDGLDNRRANLRFLTDTQSAIHRRIPNKYGHRGISKTKDKNGIAKYWTARITVTKGDRRYLGVFKTKELAIKAYLEAKEKYHADL